MVVTFETEQERQRWEVGEAPRKIFGQEAKVKARDYMVIVLRMPLNKLGSDALETIRGIYA